MFETRELLTSEGAFWELNRFSLRHRLGFYGGSIELAHAAVTNFGYVYIRQAGDRVKILLRPDRFPHRAYEALVASLLKRRIERVAIILDPMAAFGVTKVAAEFFYNIHDAVAYLDALRSMTPGEIERPQFMSAQLDMGRLATVARRDLRQAYVAWRRAKGELREQRLQKLLNQPRQADLLLTRLSERRNEIQIETWPSYMGFVPEEKISGILGNSVEGLPYPGNYPVDAAVGYHTVFSREEPLLEIVEAEIKYINGPVKRIRYERLCLPWRGKGGEIFVSSLSSFRSKAVIRD